VASLPVCRDDFDVDSLYRADGTALAEFIVLLCHAGRDVLSGQKLVMIFISRNPQYRLVLDTGYSATPLE